MQNMCILNRVDTIDVQSVSDISDCNYMLGTLKSHNKCQLIIDDSLIPGRITYRLPMSNDKIEFFDGEVSNGLIMEGTVLRHRDGRLILTGQYQENWKSGVWTTYYDGGEIHTVMIFIEHADDPIITRMIVAEFYYRLMASELEEE